MSMPAARAAAVSASRVHTAGPVASLAVSSPVSSRTSRPGGGLAAKAMSGHELMPLLYEGASAEEASAAVPGRDCADGGAALVLG